MIPWFARLRLKRKIKRLLADVEKTPDTLVTFTLEPAFVHRYEWHARRELIVQEGTKVQLSLLSTKRWIAECIRSGEEFIENDEGQIFNVYNNPTNEEIWTQFLEYMNSVDFNANIQKNSELMALLLHQMPMSILKSMNCKECKLDYSGDDLEREPCSRNEMSGLRTVRLGREILCPKGHILATIITFKWSEQYEGELDRVNEERLLSGSKRLDVPFY
jgi:hypothetical protein